jgi:arylsulfatase A-like enzyme
VLTDAAVKFISADSDKPFFAYVAFNAPHGPFQVPDAFAAPYRKLDLSAAAFPKIGQPWATPKLNTDEIADAYGMIANIDANFARLMKALDDKKLAANTLVIFLTDNGPGGVRWNAGLRNRKGTVYEGGIRVPCYIRWGYGKRPRDYDEPLAHIDITPTILDACGIVPREDLDGRSFLAPVFGRGSIVVDNRTLFWQWHRGDMPEKYRAFAARGPKYKLVQANGVAPGDKWTPKFELFDLEKDPFEEKDLAAEKPEEVARLKREYEKWFDDVTKKGFDPPRIIVGNEKENPVRLSRQDWRGPKAGWAADSVGHWELKVERAGKYEVTVRGNAAYNSDKVTIGAGDDAIEFGGSQGSANGKELTVKELTYTVDLPKGAARVTAVVTLAGKSRGADYVELKFVGPSK